MSAAMLAERAGSAWPLLPARAPWWRCAAADIARWWRTLGADRELELLDETALRDLGLHRSEVASYPAECAGLVEATRRRLAAST